MKSFSLLFSRFIIQFGPLRLGTPSRDSDTEWFMHLLLCQRYRLRAVLQLRQSWFDVRMEMIPDRDSKYSYGHGCRHNKHDAINCFSAQSCCENCHFISPSTNGFFTDAST